jgi:hypothetical protein
MERRWDSSEPSGRSRGKVVRKIKKLFFKRKEGISASSGVERKKAD